MASIQSSRAFLWLYSGFTGALLELYWGVVRERPVETYFGESTTIDREQDDIRSDSVST
jgi:hypothetical protein